MPPSTGSGAPVLTVDAGSGSGRALVFDADGTVLSIAQREWSYQPTPDAPGGIDFPTGPSWEHVCTVIREAIAKAGIDAADIKGVTATSMREGIVLWDGDGKELWAVPNADARAGEQAVALIEEGLAEPIYRTGGDWTSISAPGRLRWVQQHRPEIWEKAEAITLLGDWVLGRLSGELATDPTLGSSSGLFDLATRQWSQDVAKRLGIEHLLVPVHEPGTVFGQVSATAAAETGLAEGTPIISGGADTQLALLGGGVVDGGWGVVGGTFWLTAAVLDEPVVDPEIRLRTLCHVEPGSWMVEGVGFLHGLSTRYVRDGLLRAANPSISETDGYVFLDGLAKDVPPGANGVRYTGSNVMNARDWKHGPPSFAGVSVIDIAGTGLGAVFRAVLEAPTSPAGTWTCCRSCARARTSRSRSSAARASARCGRRSSPTSSARPSRCRACGRRPAWVPRCAPSSARAPTAR